jgi:replication factor A1
MQARLKYVDFEQLPHWAGKKALVDVVGLVTSIGALGSVKRSRDGSELARRDVTLVDQRCKLFRV